ncbi:MAG: hypothetical protein AUI14_15405 [Actinobacteria bacterium 13_2_20CM_2_71_6]|nr:MAG: hypothetical protein AUI14_15405 [Actinobacteria bacterium 13_2_20CM_2_71_6]
MLVRSVVSGLCLSVAAGGDPEGAAAQQDGCTDSPAQRWRTIPAGGGVTLVNVASGKCLDVADRGTDDGAKVQQWSCNNGANQQWRPQPATADAGGQVATGAVLLVSVNSGKCLDLVESQTASGVHLQQWSCHGRANQQWTLGS